jgi:hypothetical protein
MGQTFHKIGLFLWANFGHCSNCIRRAFFAAVVSSALVLSLLLFPESDLLSYAIVVAAGCLMLWTMHLFVFAAKVSTATVSQNLTDAPLTRRALLPVFARSLAFAVFVSAAPRTASADGACGADGCDSCRRPLYARDGTRQYALNIVAT